MSTISFQHAVVLGATGPTGQALVDVLTDAGIETRVSSRSGSRLTELYASRGLEQVVANDGNIDDARRAIAGCDVVFDCIGLPRKRMVEHVNIAQTVSTVLAETGARGVVVSNYWSYLPAVDLPLNENHPRSGGSPWMKLRRHAERVMQDSGAAIVHLPDFFGPGVVRGTMHQALQQSMEGTITWLGDAQIAHEYVFVPDAMRTVFAVAQQAEAFGERWIAPGGGPICGEDIRVIAEDHLPGAVKLRAGSLTTLRLLSWFMPMLRDFRQMLPEYVKPITFDGNKIQRLLGEQTLSNTPYSEAIGITLNWLQDRRHD